MLKLLLLTLEMGAGNMEVALRAISQANVDIGILTDAKLMDYRYTKYSHGYEAIATTAKSKAQGGVALAYRDDEAWQVEAVKRFGPNVIGFELVTCNHRYSCVGGYISPTDSDTIEFIRSAFESTPRIHIIFLGDLNVDLRRLRDDRT
jgi:exonuclease III